MKKILWWLLLALIIVKLSLFLVAQKNYFLRPFDPKFFGDLYSKSQYVVGELSEGGIGDDGLYAFAGYYYLFQGGDVSSVNFEHPPLGKYLIGLSILIFQNENIINIIYFAILLFMTYKIGQLILQNNLLALFSVAILSIDPLFLDNLLRSLLDLPFTLFFILAVYFFLNGELGKKGSFYITMFFWGAAFSTKFFPALMIIYIYLLILMFLYQRKYLKVFLISSLIIPVLYLSVHISFFFYHPSVIEFLRHKIWMLNWFGGSPRIVGNIWRNIFTGTYIDAKGKLMPNAYWTIILPAVCVLAVARFRKNFIKKAEMPMLTIYGISMLYLVYVTVLSLGVQKFIMPVYPLLIILAVGNVYNLSKLWKIQI